MVVTLAVWKLPCQTLCESCSSGSVQVVTFCTTKSVTGTQQYSVGATLAVWKLPQYLCESCNFGYLGCVACKCFTVPIAESA